MKLFRQSPQTLAFANSYNNKENFISCVVIFFLVLTIKTPSELFVGSAKWQVQSEFQMREDFGFQP